jgi:hypothetical protein
VNDVVYSFEYELPPEVAVGQASETSPSKPDDDLPIVTASTIEQTRRRFVEIRTSVGSMTTTWE